MNELQDIIEIFRQRIWQHEKHNDALMDSIEDKQDEIQRLLYIVDQVKDIDLNKMKLEPVR